MVKQTLTVVVLALTAQVAMSAAPVRTMYTAALAREQSVRATMAAADASPAVLAAVRAVVAAYEAVVAKYPASGYSDNALWQGGRLALDAFTTFGQTRDKDTGVRLLRRLAAGYPTSRLAKQVPGQLAHATDDARPAARPQGRAPQVVGAPDAPADGSSAAIGPTAAAGSNAGPIAQPGSPQGRVATIKDIRRSVLPDAVRITIELDAEVPFHEERIADPARVFLDLPGTRAAPALVDQTIRFESDADLVRQVRVGRHPNNMTRIVLDAAGVTSYSVYPLYAPYRLVIDCVRAKTTTAVALRPLDSRDAVGAARTASRTTASAPAATVVPAVAFAPPLMPSPLAARRLPPEGLRQPPSMSPRAWRLIADASAAAASAAAASTADAAPTAHSGIDGPATTRRSTPVPANAAAAPPTRNSTGGLSIARQLGLGVSRIVIDAGHGGYDPGAKGKGVTEAELVLDVALRLEKLLQNVPGVETILTRRTDEFIALPERTAIANREGADLFLSIHANASTNAQARGIETYFLNFATNLSSAAVAARENANSTQAMGALPDFVKAIALNNKLDESRDFATQVQRAMSERLKTTNKTLKDLGVKQAPFVVLIGAAMPSVLAEISFVTNPQEARLLKGNLYRQRIAEALFNAIQKYQRSLKSTTTVAPFD